MNLRLTFHQDPGHGWVEVSASDLERVGLTANDFSPYSYRRHGRFFLEEDCDAGVFIRKAESLGYEVTLVSEHTNNDHWIRNLPSIR